MPSGYSNITPLRLAAMANKIDALEVFYDNNIKIEERDEINGILNNVIKLRLYLHSTQEIIDTQDSETNMVGENHDLYDDFMG